MESENFPDEIPEECDHWMIPYLLEVALVEKMRKKESAANRHRELFLQTPPTLVERRLDNTHVLRQS